MKREEKKMFKGWTVSAWPVLMALWLVGFLVETKLKIPLLRITVNLDSELDKSQDRRIH